MSSVGSSIRPFVVGPHMLHKSCCLITRYHFPRGTAAALFLTLLLSSPLPQSYPWSSQPNTLTSFLLFYFLSIFIFETPPLLLISPLHIFSLSPISPPFMHLSSFLLDRLLSEIAAGSSVAQLAINKHLDISLLIPSPVALFFSFHFSPHTRTRQVFLSSLVFSVTLTVWTKHEKNSI